MIYAGMAMLPNRFPASLKTVKSILPQVDRLFLCLNGFTSIPDQLVHEKIEVWHCGENLGDAGKFFWPPGNYRAFLTLDDDLIYPEEYVKDFVAASELFPGAILTHAGKILPPVVRDYWADCPKVVTCFTENREPIRVDIPITAAAYFPEDGYKKFDTPRVWNCGDLYVMQQMRKHDIRAYALRHPKNYFGYLKPPAGTTIWEQTQSVDMTALCNSFLQ